MTLTLRTRPRLFAMLAAIMLGACTTVVIPPSAPTEPVSVFLIDHGRHSSLLLPTEAGGAVRYSYGDWAYYVEDRTGALSGLRAVFLPSRASLGRQDLLHAPDASRLAEQIGLLIVDAHEIRVASADVARLHGQLTSLFAASPHEPVQAVRNPSRFVEHPLRYSLLHNSNHVVGQWLTELGCTVIGYPLLPTWRIEPPTPD